MRKYKTKEDGYDKNFHPHDNYFVNLVNTDKLRVTIDGKIYNTHTKRYIANCNDSKRYCVVGYKDNLENKIKFILAHRLIWLVFNGSTEDKIINHKNGLKNDNRLVNLELVTESENNRHAIENGFHKISDKQREVSRELLINKNPNPDYKSFTEDDIREIRRLLSPYKRGDDKIVADKYNCSRELISQIRRNIIYKYIK